MNYNILTKEEGEMIPFKNQIILKPQLLVLDWTNKYFDIAKKYANTFSSDTTHKLSSIIVKIDETIGIWTNSSDYHEKEWCRRKDENGKSLYKSGEWYDKCLWCNPETSHSELLAIRNTFLHEILNNLKEDKNVLKIYKDLVEESKKWIYNSNLVLKVDYNEFMSTIRSIIWEEKFNIINKKIEEELKGSTLYLFWHYWACETCWNNCKKYWIKNIIVQKSAFTLHKLR